MVLLAGGPGHVPAVQGHLHDQRGADVRGRGGGAHHVPRAFPRLQFTSGVHRLLELLRVVLAEAGVGGEVLGHQVLGDALAARPALAKYEVHKIRWPSRVRSSLAAQAGSSGLFCPVFSPPHGPLGRCAGHLRAEIRLFHVFKTMGREVRCPNKRDRLGLRRARSRHRSHGAQRPAPGSRGGPSPAEPAPAVGGAGAVRGLLLDPALGPSRQAGVRAGGSSASQRAPGLRGVRSRDLRRGPQALHPVAVRAGPGVRHAVPGRRLPDRSGRRRSPS